MRIVLAADGTRGDVHPLLAFGASLAARGHDVRVCAPPDFETDARERGLEFHAVGIPVRAYMEERAARFGRGGAGVLAEMQRYLERVLALQMTRLPELVAGADRVIGAGIQFGAHSAAELRGVPYRYVAYCPAALPSAQHPPFMIPHQGLPPWLNRLSWRVMQIVYDATLRRRLNRERARIGLAPVPEIYPYLATTRPVLAADAALAPAPEDCPFAVQQIPCLHPAAAQPLPEKLERFLEAGPAPVYVGFGSMPDPDPAATTRSVLAAVERLGCRALLSAGWAGLGEAPLPSSVMVLGSVSHAALFPRVSVVVHHGGAGTTTTAARAGVPQLVVPHVLDQHYWGRRVAALGLGPPPLRKNRLSADRLAETLASTIENELVTARSRELGERLRSDLSAYDPAKALLEA